MTFQEAVGYLNDVPRFTQKHKLSHTRRLLGLLGHPEESFEVIHVAGSNGKGSVCSYLDQTLRLAGIRTARFVSPHLVTIRERFTVDGEMISEEDFLRIFEQVMELTRRQAPEDHPTYFEFLFLMGMLYFKEQHVQVVVLETGLGGRLDATNAVAHPVLTILTSIALEHTEYLGESITQIAGEKAGIIKAGVPVIYDANDSEADAVIADRAAELATDAYPVRHADAKGLTCTESGLAFSYQAPYDIFAVNPATYALYQVDNAMLAAAALSLYFHAKGMDASVIEKGIASAKWPGRMELAADHIIFDGAHNPSGMEAFLHSAKAVTGKNKALLLFSALDDKNYRQMIRMIEEADLWSEIIVTQLDTYRAASGESLCKQFTREITYIPSLAEAFSYAKSRISQQYLFCCGSLYLIGELEKLI